MAVHVLFGKNGSGKTRYLEKIARDYTINRKIVVSNLKNMPFAFNIDMEKVKYMEEIGDEAPPFGEFGSCEWNSYMSDYTLKTYVEMILCKGNILILDEIDSYINLQQLICLCNLISNVKSLWDEIYISGHNSYLTITDNDANVQLFYMNGDKINILGSDTFEYREFM